MWALRRVSHPLRMPGFRVGTCCANLELRTTHVQHKDKDKDKDKDKPCLFGSGGNLPSKRLYYTTPPHPHVSRCLSSQAGRESSGEEHEHELEDGFSELETPPTAVGDAIQTDNEQDISETGTGQNQKRMPWRRKGSPLFEAILEFPGLSVHSALDKWAEEGKDLSREDISSTMLDLCKRRMFGRALQLSEWLEAHKQIEFIEKDYASRLDLIAKVRGLQKAEKYVEIIPKSFRSEVIYRTMLANCVATSNLKKAESIFNKMKDLEFPVTSFTCNQLLLLYKKLDKKKIADVLLLMEKENVKPTAFTYKLLVDMKGQSNDISGMEQVYETMKTEGIEPDITVKAILAKHYTSGGLKQKAEVLLKEMEGGNLKENRWACQALLPLYAELGQADEVGRVWEVCVSNPRVEECMAAIEAWGKLDKIEEAEAAFDRMLKIWKQLSSRHYAVLLKVYANHKMLAKGKYLLKRMADSNCEIGPEIWDALIKLYVEIGEVEKADSILQKAVEKNHKKPMFSSYMAIMDQYSKRGDIHNSEKIFHRMRLAGYTARLRQFQSLVQAYLNAKVPAYGIWERMKSDNIFPNKALLAQLAQVDPFKKTSVSDLLD